MIYGAYVVWNASKDETVSKNMKPPWGEQVGKTRYIQSKHGDASMATELSRRRAIQSVSRLNPSKIRESRTSSGASTGALEAFFISSICPQVVVKAVCELLFDSGYAYNDYMDVLDGVDGTYDVVYDAGDPDTNVCPTESA